MNLVALSGSLREASHHTAMLRSLGELAGDGISVRLLPLDGLPHFNEDLEPAPPLAVAQLRQAVTEADALVIASPEYNGGVTGVIKDALDWLSRPRGQAALGGKPVLTFSASPGGHGAIWAQEALRASLQMVGAQLVGPPISLPNIHLRIVEGRPDADLAAELRGLLTELRRAAAATDLARAS